MYQKQKGNHNTTIVRYSTTIGSDRFMLQKNRLPRVFLGYRTVMARSASKIHFCRYSKRYIHNKFRWCLKKKLNIRGS